MRMRADVSTVKVMVDRKAERVTRVSADLLARIEAFEGRPVSHHRPGHGGSEPA